MSLTTESAEAFTEMLSEFGTPIVYNGVSAQCLAMPIESGETQQLQGYIDNIKTKVRMLASDFALWDPITERVSEVSLGGETLLYVSRISHPNVSWVHLLLASPS